MYHTRNFAATPRTEPIKNRTVAKPKHASPYTALAVKIFNRVKLHLVLYTFCFYILPLILSSQGQRSILLALLYSRSLIAVFACLFSFFSSIFLLIRTQLFINSLHCAHHRRIVSTVFKMMDLNLLTSFLIVPSFVKKSSLCVMGCFSHFINKSY